MDFTDKFNKKYGADSHIMLTTMFKDPLISLQDIAIYFGFSRESASRYFKKVFGRPYSQCKNSRSLSKIRFFRGRVHLIYSQALKILRNEGFCPLLIPHKSSYRIVVNGYVLAVRRLYLSHVNPKFYTAVKGRSQVDFFLLFTPACSYLIPLNQLPEGISIPVGSLRSKYQKFKDNFMFLYSVPAGCRGPLK